MAKVGKKYKPYSFKWKDGSENIVFAHNKARAITKVGKEKWR
jgi:hypothetical protein